MKQSPAGDMTFDKQDAFYVARQLLNLLQIRWMTPISLVLELQLCYSSPHSIAISSREVPRQVLC